MNILTIDLEDWYHPEYVKGAVSTDEEQHIQSSSNRTLGLLRKYQAKATFFVVGQVAEHHPNIMEKIDEQGHEIAFHGYYHKPLWETDAEGLRQEIQKFNMLLDGRCKGFRAPSFSLSNRTKWALDVLEEARYLYDSSIFPCRTPLYGVSGAPTEPYKISHTDVTKNDEEGTLWEFPVLTYTLLGLRIPVSGGFYLRTFPLGLIRRAIRKMNERDQPAVVYVHNWELDPDTPRRNLGLYKSYVTYHNIEKTEKKLEQLLGDFTFLNFRDYMEERGGFFR